MKDSKEKWIGLIPDSWGMNTVFQLFTQVKNKNSDLREQNLLSLSYGKIKRKDIETTDGLLPESFDGYNIIEADDIVLRLTDLQNDQRSLRVGLATERGIVTSAYLTLRNRSTSVPKYLYYYLHAFDISKGFYGMGAGVRQGLNWDGLKWLKILTPPVAEQRRIADFLDRRCAEIDGVIEATKKTIEEYKALKQSIITEAVTGQCAIGNVQGAMGGKRRMKDSGIEWIGEIPEEWEVSRVGLHFEIILGKMLCSEQQTNEQSLEKYFCAANVHFEGISDMNILKEMWFSPAEKQLYAVKNGDLLVVEGGAGAGGSAIVCGLIETAYVQNSIMIVRAKDQQDNRYLRYLLEYLVKQGYIDVVCNKATIPRFTKDKLANVPYPVMSSEEQTMIADFLDRNCLGIDQIVVAKQTLLSELETYKKSVIYEYVTGKREVI